MYKARKGRPRISRPAIDRGTPELQAKRQFAIGPKRPGWPEPNVSDAEHALGVLLWRGTLAPTFELSKRMYDAGIQFASWWKLVYPKCTPTGTLGALQPGSSSDPDVEEARRLLTEASQFLKKERAILDAVINTVVYDRIQPKKYASLRTGLCRLIEWQKKQRRAV